MRSRERSRVRKDGHHVISDSLDFINSLKLCPFIRSVGIGKFREISNPTGENYYVKGWDSTRKSYIVEAKCRRFTQILYVGVDVSRRIMLERFVDLYQKHDVPPRLKSRGL